MDERRRRTVGEPVEGARILVVEDEASIADVVARYLRREGHDVETVADGKTALERFEAAPPGLIVLDLMLPGLDGQEVLRRVRAKGDTPVVILTARGEELDRLVGFGLGADDYVTKPFSPRELAARVQAVLRRSTRDAPATPGGGIRIGDLYIDGATRVVEVAGEPIPMTAREFDLLYFLAEHPGQVFSRDQLIDAVWDYNAISDAGTVTVHIRRIRAKLEPDPSRPRYLKTVWGVGYKLEP
jgi:DNA-binding response OmpR family regulator